MRAILGITFKFPSAKNRITSLCSGEQWRDIRKSHRLPPGIRSPRSAGRESSLDIRFPLNVGYSEGWGLYSESLGYELGFYEDPLVRFGHLGAEMFRACRLVVDTGIHALGWSQERAVKYMVDNNPSFGETMIRQTNRIP